jgi:hypothetical protein
MFIRVQYGFFGGVVHQQLIPGMGGTGQCDPSESTAPAQNDVAFQRLNCLEAIQSILISASHMRQPSSDSKHDTRAFTSVRTVSHQTGEQALTRPPDLTAHPRQIELPLRLRKETDAHSDALHALPSSRALVAGAFSAQGIHMLPDRWSPPKSALMPVTLSNVRASPTLKPVTHEVGHRFPNSTGARPCWESLIFATAR